MRQGSENLVALDCVLSSFVYQDGVFIFIWVTYVCAYTLAVEEVFFLYLSGISVFQCFCVSAFSPVNGHHCQELGTFFFIPSQQGFIHMDQIPLIFPG